MAAGGAGRFRLVRYFTATSLVAFSLVALALFVLERAEKAFLDNAQREQAALFERSQADLGQAQKRAARASLLAEHEAGHVTLARVLANTLWDRHFAPRVAMAARLPLESCRALPAASAEQRACIARLAEALRAGPASNAADAAVQALVRDSAVFKVKVYDSRGLTVYSSEPAQIGEDKGDNMGWRTAAAGQPASELVHRDRFSAFERTVENRDLIQSYIPVRGPDNMLRGVFEIYSDVTPLLAQAEALSAEIGRAAAENRAAIQRAAERRGRAADAESLRHFAVVALLLAALYVVLLLVVRHAQQVIDAQVRAAEAAAQREHAGYREKMAALATLAANASHDIGNPLAVIQGAADELPAAASVEEREAAARRIGEQVARIAEMRSRITDFTEPRGEAAVALDVNGMLRSVADFLSFDNRYRTARIALDLAPELPECIGSPDHLNEVLMALLPAYVEAGVIADPRASHLLVSTRAQGGEVGIEIRCERASDAPPCVVTAEDPRVDAARRLVEGMGGRLEASPSQAVIRLPCRAAGQPR